MKESIVEISGHKYRYSYDPGQGKTVYLGPVGDAPAISEAEFNLLVAQVQKGWENLSEQEVLERTRRYLSEQYPEQPMMKYIPEARFLPSFPMSKIKRVSHGKSDENKVRKYSRALKRGDVFPPIFVLQDYTILDGYHRHLAYRRLGFDEIPVVMVRLFTWDPPMPEEID